MPTRSYTIFPSTGTVGVRAEGTVPSAGGHGRGGGAECPRAAGPKSAPSARASRSGLHAAIGRALFSTRFVTIWLALGALLVVCRIVAPETLSSASWSTLLPTGSIVAVVALGQMAVIMMGGIDLSMGATISLLANVLVGVAKGQDDRLPQAILVVLILGIIIGLVNGLLVAVLELNPLIVTLSTG